MRHRILGKTGLNVSEIGFGGIPIQTLSHAAAVEVVRRALDLGIDFIDTARAYTTSEERIGEAIRGQRSKCMISTKTTARTAEGVEKDLEKSLSLLGTSSIELYQLHNVSNDEMLDQVIKPGGPLDMMKKARSKGKIQHIGITSHRPSVLIRAIKTGEFEALMVPLNYVERTPLLELIPLANQLNIGTIIMKPIGGGAFSNATEALKFVLREKISTVIPGMCSIQEVEENTAVGSMSVELSREAEMRLKEQAKILGQTFCRGCDYCQPCPEGIPISTLMRVQSSIKRMGWYTWKTKNQDAIEKYEKCQECRECESRCPYELPILDIMTDKIAWLKEQYDRRA
jgi:hypothetical protein